VVQRVEEKKMRIQDPGENVRCDEDVVLGKKGEGDRLRDTEEVGQQGVEDKGTKKRDKERSKIRDRQEMLEILGNLTKKRGQQCLPIYRNVSSSCKGADQRETLQK